MGMNNEDEWLFSGIALEVDAGEDACTEAGDTEREVSFILESSFAFGPLALI